MTFLDSVRVRLIVLVVAALWFITESQNLCTLPSSLPAGYQDGGLCTGSRSAVNCDGMACSSGLYAGSVTVSCPTDNGTFSLSGCQAFCSTFSFVNCLTANKYPVPNPSSAICGTNICTDTECCSPGTVSGSCLIDANFNYYGGDLSNALSYSQTSAADCCSYCATVTGCEFWVWDTQQSSCLPKTAAITYRYSDTSKTSGFIPKYCSLPASMPAGYVVSSSGCEGSRRAVTCAGISCASNYQGQVTVLCAANGDFVFTGCNPIPIVPTGFTFSPSSPTTADQLTITFTGGQNIPSPFMKLTEAPNCSVSATYLMFTFPSSFGTTSWTATVAGTIHPVDHIICYYGGTGWEQIGTSSISVQGTTRAPPSSFTHTFSPDPNPTYVYFTFSGGDLSAQDSFTVTTASDCQDYKSHLSSTGFDSGYGTTSTSAYGTGIPTDGTYIICYTVLGQVAGAATAVQVGSSFDITFSCTLPSPLPTGYTQSSAGWVACSPGYGPLASLQCNPPGGSYIISGCFGSLPCNFEFGVGYFLASENLFNEVVTGFDACCERCMTVSACKAWSFTTFDNQCYLKSGMSSRQTAANHVSGYRILTCVGFLAANCGPNRILRVVLDDFACEGPVCTAYDCCLPLDDSCLMESGIDYYGFDIDGSGGVTSSPVECCYACTNHPDCAYWTWALRADHQGSCWLKYAGAEAGRQSNTYDISGVRSTLCQLPTSTPAGYQLNRANCAGNQTAQDCSVGANLLCAAGYTPCPEPQLLCSRATGLFSFVGCCANRYCVPPPTSTATNQGYSLGTSCSSSDSVQPTDCMDTVCANGFYGSPLVMCTQANATLTFSGCSANLCSLPGTLPTGYAIKAVGGSCAGAQTGNNCLQGFGCDVGFTGRPRLSCGTNGSTFTVEGGCSVNNCTLPSTIPVGYRRNDTAGNCSGFMSPQDCLSAIECATSFTGQANLSCNSNNGRFTFSGCTALQCQVAYWDLPVGYALVSPTTPPTAYRTAAMAFGVKCALGYSGTVAYTCLESFGAFNFSGCFANNCSMPSRVPSSHSMNGTCDGLADALGCAPNMTCGAGYTGTPQLSCWNNGGQFSLSGCSANLCELPSAIPTGYNIVAGSCVGLQKAAVCGGRISCQAGYHGQVNLTCAENGTIFELSGCNENECKLPSILPTGYRRTNTIGSCCDGCYVTQALCLGEVECIPGYSGSVVYNCAADHSTYQISGCSANVCTLPAIIPAGYRLPQRTSCPNDSRVDLCLGFQCALGYTGTPVVFCVTNATEFTLTGCSPNNCTLRTPHQAGYISDGSCVAAGLVTVADCYGVQCASGYIGTASLSCPTNNGYFGLSGCEANKCTLPNAGDLPDGHQLFLGGLPCSGFQTATKCVQARGIQCSIGYTGSVKLVCSTNGSVFEPSGCTLKNCSLPTRIPTGYDATSADCAGLRTISNCAGLVCATGYTGTPTLTCANQNGKFTFSGCSENNCTLPDLSNTPYRPSVLCNGTRTSTACRGLVCISGYSGTVKMTCPTNSGEFVLSGCTINNCSFGTTLSTGYVWTSTNLCRTTSTRGTVSECAVDVDCAAGYTGTVKLSCPVNSRLFSVSGCSANMCQLVSTTGYKLSTTCVGLRTKAACTGTVCASGYFGSVQLSCLTNSSTFTLSGCKANNCTLPLTMPLGYAYLGSGCEGPLPVSSCTSGLLCSSGYYGTVEVNCTSNNGRFTLSGCSLAV